MYTILITDSNELVTTVRERIMQRSKLVDDLHFLMEPTYNGFDMSKFTATMQYITPVSRELRTETLALSEALYKDMLEYKLPVDTNITKEAGDFAINLTFTWAEMTADGAVKQHVRKIDETTIKIIPISAWCDIVPDAALDALDQKILAIDARINAVEDLSTQIHETKADNIHYDEFTDTIQLMANGKTIGDAIVLKDDRGVIDIEVAENGHMIVNYDDGTMQDIGIIGDSGGAAGIYVPRFENDKLIFELKPEPGDEQVVYDLDKSNNWGTPEDEGITTYLWESI